ncbi:hypothetical protein [Bacillus thuringiensis]|uniref:hypothetical protein n=1 Tax=Bacillus thuringiensis TaxID=1428 RepID=UPI000BFCA236|nr:hypothetical protein [Bacillus thuringiensis]PGK76506.1 hypothetical protein CN919_18140 [Bacillus thuringiensis]
MKKKAASIIGIGVICALCASFTINSKEIASHSNSNSNTSKAVAQNQKNDLTKPRMDSLEEIKVSADLAKTYNSVDELINSSDIVIEGKITERKHFDFKTNTFTHLKVQVTKSFNDKVKVNDIINVIEAGGVTTKGKIQEYYPEKMKLQENELNKPIEILFDGAPNSKKDENVLIFGGEIKDNFFGLNETAYMPLNSYQGKFSIDTNNKVKRYSGEETAPLAKNKQQAAASTNSKQSSSLETSLENMEQQIIEKIKK